MTDVTTPTAPAIPSGASQFDFWLGDWDVSWGDGLSGTNHIRKVLGDRVIQVSTVTLGLDGPSPAIGDWLVVHTGFAVERLTEAAADEIQQARRGLAPSTLELDPKERS